MSDIPFDQPDLWPAPRLVPEPATPAERPPLVCLGCGKTPEEIGYAGFKEEGQTDSDYVWSEEGTLNRENGHFLCDGCYIAAGMPSGPRGWTCP